MAPPAKWLLDTNVLSELRRPRPDQRVITWIEAHPLEDLYISTVTLAEIRFGIETLPDAVRRANLEAWLTEEVRPMFTHRTLEITEDIMVRWRQLVEEGPAKRAYLLSTRPHHRSNRAGARLHPCDAQRERLRRPRRHPAQSLGDIDSMRSPPTPLVSKPSPTKATSTSPSSSNTSSTFPRPQSSCSLSSK